MKLMIGIIIGILSLFALSLAVQAQDDALVPALCGDNGVAESDLVPLDQLAWLNDKPLSLIDLTTVYSAGTPVETIDTLETVTWPYATRPAAGWGDTALIDRGDVSWRVIELWRGDGTVRTVWWFSAPGSPDLLWPSDRIKSVGHPPVDCSPVTLP